MAQIYPRLSEEQLSELPSKAEATVYRLCKRLLGDDYTVLHSVEWIVKVPSGRVRDGEADFLICSPTSGILVLEVKGGGIRHDATTDTWYSTDGHGVEHDIADPFRQARNAKYAVLGKLKEHPRWTCTINGKLLVGHAVLFPNVPDVRHFHGPDVPAEIVGGNADLSRLSDWVAAALRFWMGSDPSIALLGAPGVKLVKDVFAKSVNVRPLLSDCFASDEATHIRLTNQQARLLGLLAGRRRVAVCGGAGTGKTLLALEKARRLAGEGFRTLLVCFNRPLANHLGQQVVGLKGLAVRSFHQLCAEVTASVKRSTGRDLLQEAAAAYPSHDVYDVHFPFALASSLELIAERYDAIVVDEGQDFREEYWLPVEMMLADEEQSPLYIFFDQNQAIYSRASTFPVRDAPYVLTVNCRNTRVIHDTTYQFFRGDKTDGPELQGVPVETLCAPSRPAQAVKIQQYVTKLLTAEHLQAGDIVVLIANGEHRQECCELLTALPLPRPAKWHEESPGDSAHLLIDTVARFKGLEAPATILWAFDGLTREQHLELLYVGTSRAKSLLCVAGDSASCDGLLRPRASPLSAP